jgi:hypothetical protein
VAADATTRKRQERVRRYNDRERHDGLDPFDEAGRWLLANDPELAPEERTTGAREAETDRGQGEHAGAERRPGSSGCGRRLAAVTSGRVDPAGCSHIWATIAHEGALSHLFCHLCKSRRPA